MGNAEPVGSQQEDEVSSGLRPRSIFAINTGRCVEDSYPEGSILLNLGSGDLHWDKWINVDQKPDGWHTTAKHPDVVADVTDLPYPDNHVDAIAAIHLIEHFYKWEVQDILKEWLRVLKPGGRLILECPSMEKVFKYIANAMDRNIPMSATFSFLPIYGDPKFKNVAMCHKWGYFFSTLKMELVKAGYVDISVSKPRYHYPQRDMRLTSFKPSSTT